MENTELEFEVVPDAEVVPGLANANALVHDPFAWQVED
jgi:hypothetical protein